MGSIPVAAFTGRIEGITVVLLRPDWGQCNIFRGGAIYGGSCSELEAYLFLSRSALCALPPPVCALAWQAGLGHWAPLWLECRFVSLPPVLHAWIPAEPLVLDSRGSTEGAPC